MLYIKPPRGNILLSELEECVETRIKYFILKYKDKTEILRGSVKFEYLTIGTALDRIGHFILRLISLESATLRDFVASSEAKFIVERLEFTSSPEIVKLMKTTLRHVNDVCDTDISNCSWSLEITNIFSTIKNAFKNSHMVNFAHNESCRELELKVPFEMCVSLVAKRECYMKRGFVIVPCGKWKMFLKSFIEAHIKKEMSKIELISEQMTDQRLKDLRDIVHMHFFKSDGSSLNKSWNIKHIDDITSMFPPCMMSLYNNLKLKHRLSHSARFNFTLFLKDIGMPINESISFWRNEYSKATSCGAKCSHSWQKDSSKYIYSIRHMYGLEGKRANYRSPLCSLIQNTVLGPSEEGGCPFMNYDINNLKELLDPTVVDNKGSLDKLLELKSDRKFSEACRYYCTKLTTNVDIHPHGVECYSPVVYFRYLHKYCNLDKG